MSRRRILDGLFGHSAFLVVAILCFPVSWAEPAQGSAGLVSGRELRQGKARKGGRGDTPDAADAQREEALARMERIKERMEEKARQLELLQDEPLARAVLTRYPALRTGSKVLGAPPKDEIVLRSIEKPRGSECSIITVWRREHLVGSDALGGGGRLLEDLWGVLPDGSLRKLGSRHVGMMSMSSFYRLDAQVLHDYLYRCVKVHNRNTIRDLFFELTMLPVPAFRLEHDPPLVVPLDRVADLANLLPPKTSECFLEKSKEIATILTIPREATRPMGYVERRCVMFTNVDPLWSVADLVCMGYVFSKTNDLVHAEVLYHRQCGTLTDPLFWRK